MNTKLYVLGAVLGTAPAFVPDVHEPPKEPVDAGHGGATRGAPKAEEAAPRHPCQLITILQVPCDPSKEVCEYTYWECPDTASPFRA